MDVKADNISQINILILTAVLTFITSVLGILITQWVVNHYKKSDQLLSAPKLLIIPLKDTKALMTNLDKITSYNKIFQIHFHIIKSLDNEQNDISSSIEFIPINKETILQEFPIANSVFLGVKCDNKGEEGLSLYRIIDKNKKTYDIDSSIVLRTLESGDSFGFICNEKDAPSGIEGSFWEQSGRYDIKHFLGSSLHFKKYAISKNN
ncbi:hypothetical protein [Scatolibacter rhodanostii]|uniref:hypothetical protein n=1 Tax=Scatolibacter rhodanostii TaxID=2014781 RepID=UPI000C069BD4|nr:hypothetical protein [Scatolibacter rhodanostii]